MTDTLTPEATEVKEPKARKVKDKTPCLCSQLVAHTEVVHAEDGGNGIPDEELTTGCPGVLTSKVFAPGHDAKAVGFLLEVTTRPDMELWFSSVGTDPETAAKRLGDALYLKFLTGRDNLTKRDAAKADRAAERLAKKAATEEAKATKKAEKEAAKAAAAQAKAAAEAQAATNEA